MSNFDPQGRRNNVPTGNYNIDLNSIMDLNFNSTPNTSNTMTSSSSTTAPLRPQVDEATLYKTAEVRMEAAFSNLEKGNFQLGLDEIVETIRILSSFPNPELVKRELRMCTAYKLLFMLLLESKKSEDNVVKGALLSRILADIPVQPKHRLVCFRMAIRKNLQVRNYKTTARFIKIILPMNLQDRKQMEDNLKLCEDNHLQNFQKYPFVCPACASSVDGGDTQCSNCNHRIIYCCQTFQPISQGFYLSCNFCESVFSNLVVSPQSKCALCLSGTLVVTEVPSSGVTPTLLSTAHMTRSLGNLPSMVANPPTTTPVAPLSPSAMSASQPRLPSMETSASFPTNFPTTTTPPISPQPQNNNWADFSNFPAQATERRASISGLPTPPAATNSRASDRLSLRMNGPIPGIDPIKDQARTAAPIVAPIVKEQAKTAAPFVAPIVKEQAKTAAPVVTSTVKDQAKAMMNNPKVMESIKQSVESKVEPPTHTKVPPPLPAKDREPIPVSKSAPPELPPKPADSIFTPPNDLKVDHITFDQRSRYTKLFAQADTDKDGFVNGDDAKKFFNDAMLPRKTLAQVWRLSDRQKRGKLDKEDFALAMHFTLCALKSLELPTTTPSQFLNETIDNLLEAKPVPIPIPGSISEEPKLKPAEQPDTGRGRSASVSTEPKPRKNSVSFAEPLSISTPSLNPPPALITPNPPPLPPKEDHTAPTSDFPFEEDAPVAKPPPKLSIPPSPKVPTQVTPPTTTATPPVLPTKPTIPPKPIAATTPVPTTTTPPPVVDDKKEKILSPSKSGGTIGRSGPPKLTVLPAALLPKPEPKIEAPVVETTAETHSTLVPPPTLTVPPMFNTPALTNSAPKEEKKAPEPPPAKWYNYVVEKQGKVPEKKDYLSDLPHDIKIAVSFVNKLIKDAAFSVCHEMLADAIKVYVTEDQLREFGEYYSTLPELNYCAAWSAKQAELTVVFVPMYSTESNNQAKVWISEDKVSGLEFSELNEEAWAKEGAVEKHIIDQPKIVIKTDGKVLEICSPKEEYEAMNDPKVPWVLEAGPERRMKAVYGKTLTPKEKKPSIVRKGKDGKKYYVFSQTSVNDTTRKIHPDAYVREYWMSDESHPYCYLLDRNGRRLSDEQYLELPNGELEPLSNLSKATKKRKDLNKPIPNLEHFYISTVIPPETPSQASLLHTFRSQPNGTTTPDQKGYITAIVPRSDQSIVYMIEWEMLMRTTTLKPRYEGINYLKEVQPISEEDRRNNVRASPIYNFDNLEFEKWLSKVGLIKGVTTFSEDLSFAKRTYLRVLELCTLVSPSTSFAASEIIISGKTDAIGINVLFVAILRASNIPARLVHRKNPPKATKSNREVVEEDPPVVQSQFYVEHIGWLVADLSLNARGKNPNFNPNNPVQLLSGFGVDDSKSVITGVDGLNFVELPGLGHRILSLDGPTILFEHKILTNNWLLTEVPNVNKT